MNNLKSSWLFTLLHDKLGINTAIFYTIGARIIQAIGGVFTLFFIAKYLNIEEQGYYYTFGSILALQVFFELGLSGILSQYVAHEVVHLKWQGFTLTGEERNVKRLASLLHFSVRWFGSMAFFLFLFLFVSGYAFFSFYKIVETHVEWQYPWFLLVTTSSLNLLVTPLLSFFEGLNKVEQVAKLRFIQQVASILLVWGALMLGFNLFATGVATLVTFMVALIWLFLKNQINILKNIWSQYDKAIVISWKNEILPYQWRIALSWISGYLSFQIFNPVLFATEGSVMAGKMGMTLTVFNGITSLAMSWINTKIPVLSGYIALKEYVKLDILFFKTFKQGFFICFLLVIFYLLGIKFLSTLNIQLVDRFLSIDLLFLLAFVTLSNIVVFFLAVYLRCFKREPYLSMSLVMGITTTLSTLILGHLFGVYGIVLGYTCLSLFMYLPWAIKVFLARKKEWSK